MALRARKVSGAFEKRAPAQLAGLICRSSHLLPFPHPTHTWIQHVTNFIPGNPNQSLGPAP